MTYSTIGPDDVKRTNLVFPLLIGAEDEPPCQKNVTIKRIAAVQAARPNSVCDHKLHLAYQSHPMRL